MSMVERRSLPNSNKEVFVVIEMVDNSSSDQDSNRPVKDENAVDNADAASAEVQHHSDPDDIMQWEMDSANASRENEFVNEAELATILAALGDETGNAEGFLISQIELLRSLSRTGSQSVGDADFRPPRDCCVCFDLLPLSLRPCCRQPICDQCIQSHIETQLLSNGNVRIGCPHPECDKTIYQDEVRSALSAQPDLRERYDRWIVDLNGNARRKTCPRCCLITDLDDMEQSSTAAVSVANIQVANRRNLAANKNGLKVRCTECQLDWCFSCQAPWHEGISCKQYRAGDVLLKNWAREKPRLGECNAQRCPSCKVYIQRIEGCDHMTCNRCNAEFCYRCGDYRRTLTLFGFPFEDHDWKHSIIGCKEKFKPDRPVQRVLARGAIFSAKVVGGVVAAPVVVGLAAGVAAIALPAYGTYRLAKTVRKRMDDVD